MFKQEKNAEATGRYAYEGLERIVHEKARLCILTSLMANSKGLVFSDLKALCALTDGNLSRHLQILQDAGLIEIWKSNRGRRPQTLSRLTPAGRKRFLEYLTELERVVRDAAVTKVKRNKADKSPVPSRWSPA